MNGVTSAVCVTALSVVVAIGCFSRAHVLRQDASWLLERSQAQAVEYAQSFDGAVAEQQLRTFEQRRTVLERAHVWQRVQMIAVLVAAVAGLCAYALYLLRRLHSQLDEASEGLHDAGAEPAASLSPPLPR